MLTCAENIIATIAGIKQQKNRDNIAHTRLVGGIGSAVSFLSYGHGGACRTDSGIVSSDCVDFSGFMLIPSLSAHCCSMDGGVFVSVGIGGGVFVCSGAVRTLTIALCGRKPAFSIFSDIMMLSPSEFRRTMERLVMSFLYESMVRG